MNNQKLISLLSVVIPVYGCNGCLKELFARLKQTLMIYADEIEIIFVDDSSPDDSWVTIKKLSQHHKEIKGIKLSRNFGQYAATHAGLEKAKGDWIVVMDCDLQDPPEEIPKLLNNIQGGFHIIRACRKKRDDSWHRKLTSKLFYKIFGYMTNTKQDSALTNFGLYSRKSIDALLSVKDYIKFFPILISWVGFKSIVVDTEHSGSHDSKSSYNFMKLLDMAVSVIISFSDKPLMLMVKYGFVFIALSFFASVITLILYFTDSYDVRGYTSLILSIWLLGSVIVFSIGLVGMYVGKAFDQVKQRPIYIVEEDIDTITLQ